MTEPKATNKLALFGGMCAFAGTMLMCADIVLLPRKRDITGGLALLTLSGFSATLAYNCISYATEACYFPKDDGK